MADYISPTFQTGQEVDQALTAGLQSRLSAAKSVDIGLKNVITLGFGTKTVKDITITTNRDGSITLNGTLSGSSNTILVNDLASQDLGSFEGLHNPFPINGTYTVVGLGRSDLKLQLLAYNSSSDYSAIANDSDNVDVTIDGTYKYYTFRLWVAKNATFDNLTIRPMCCLKDYYTISTAAVKALDVLDNTYLPPADADGTVSSAAVDMTAAIKAKLATYGICRLGKGQYYVSGVDMPYNTTIIGCGRGTQIKLLDSVTSGYCIRMTRQCTVRDLQIQGQDAYYNGAYADITTIGTRNGIVWLANRSGTEADQPNIEPCTIENVFIKNFTGSGLYLHNTGGGTQEALTVNDVTIWYCKVGINIDWYTEYCKFTNDITYRCGYACINNGGNNVFSSCTFHGVVGMQLDNTGSTLRNEGHGSAIGCTFNHIDNMNHSADLGMGDGIIMKNNANGFVFSGCQIWYAKILLVDSPNVLFTGCEIGGARNNKNPSITVTGNGARFMACAFMNAPDLTVTADTIFSGCYLPDGREVKPSKLDLSGVENLITIGSGFKTSHAVTVTSAGDGSIIIDGKNNSSTGQTIVFDLADLTAAAYAGTDNPFPTNGTYVVHGTGDENIRIQVLAYNDSSDWNVPSNTHETHEFTVDGTYQYYQFRIYIKGDAEFHNMRIYPLCYSADSKGAAAQLQMYQAGYQDLYERVLALENPPASLSMANPQTISPMEIGEEVEPLETSDTDSEE